MISNNHVGGTKIPNLRGKCKNDDVALKVWCTVVGVKGTTYIFVYTHYLRFRLFNGCSI